MSDVDTRAIYDILNKMREDVAVIRETTHKLDKAVNGNGKPGLLDRMTVIEERQSSCPARKAVSDGAVNNRIAVYALILASALAAMEMYDRISARQTEPQTITITK